MLPCRLDSMSTTTEVTKHDTGDSETVPLSYGKDYTINSVCQNIDKICICYLQSVP